ncbi:hypothetical protein ALI22I_42370 [Saccharothrix sp. ALI-22-I]|uniref:alpha/beta hydrolase n=1 Tax=Saccharothrix sp. ALI-22-I TaxID=1933778 RepID=UPI00097C365F|nr:alpha/beta hydrolase family protein [Saccharothrix sp. ALI-22-I]ONI80080.1 hypothetical protein ALI22I_42370 [Saccharothrix sp. ALI-22-I]
MSLRSPLAVVAALVVSIVVPAPPAVAVVADNGATVVKQTRLDDRTYDLTINSPAIGGNVPVRLLTPPGWSPTATRTWPVLFLLQGCGDDYTSWTRETDVEQLSASSDVLIAMPDGGRAGWYSDWWNGGRGGTPGWETFHMTELVQLLERGYRAGTSRAIAGLSAGGTGAFKYAAKRPGYFKAAASYSGILSTQFVGVPQYVGATVLREGMSADALWGDDDFQASVWRANNPKELASGLRGTSLYMSYGNGFTGPLDPGFDYDANERIVGNTSPDFVLRMRLLNIPITVNAYGDGTHTWPYWQRELRRSWPQLMTALGVPG